MGIWSLHPLENSAKAHNRVIMAASGSGDEILAAVGGEKCAVATRGRKDSNPSGGVAARGRMNGRGPEAVESDGSLLPG